MRTKDKYALYITSLLTKGKFMAGREIVEQLQEHFTLTDANARKILQRTVDSGLIVSSKPITFGKGQFIYMMPGDIPSIHIIKSICKKYRPPIYRILDVLEDNGGILSYYEALKVSASSKEKTSTKANTVNELIQILLSLELVTIEKDEHDIKYIVSKELINPSLALVNHYSKMVLDSMFIPDMLKWLRTINIIDNIKTVYRSKQNPSKGALHNNLVWDAFAYTKTTGINEVFGKRANSIEKQTLVVLDVVINREYSPSDLDGFLARVQVNLNSVKEGKRKVMPIIFYNEISDKVRNTIGSLGFLSFDIGSVFGNRIHEIVNKINTIQKSNGNEFLDHEGLEDEIDDTLSTIREAGQEDNLSNLKGVLFEYLLYPVISSFYPNASISHGKILSEKKDGSKEAYEYDFIVLSENPKELLVIEAKGYSSESRIQIGSSDTKNTLSWFFGKTIPFLKKKYTKELSEGYKLKASYITSAGFYDDGIKYLNKLTTFQSKKLAVYYSGDDLLQLLKDNDFSHISKTVERYYIKKEK